MNRVWDLPGVTAEERLILIWIANSSADLGCAVMLNPYDMGQFIGADYYRAHEVLEQLTQRGLIRWGTDEEETASYVWLTYEGEYYPPIDWTAETKSRSRRVEALIERDGPNCVYCGCFPIVYHVDHFIPKAKGGADKMSNLVLACATCNLAKRDKMPEVFLSGNTKLFHTLSTNLKYLHE